MATSIVRSLSLGAHSNFPAHPDSESGELVSESRVLGLSASYACVNLLAGTISTLPIIVYKSDPDGTAEKQNNHWIKKLLDESPNEDETSVDFWEFIVTCLELRGNAYALKSYNASRSRIISLAPIHPDLIQKATKNGEKGYYYNNDQMRRVWVPKRNMFHIKGYLGLSTLSIARHVLGMAIAVDKSANATFKNGPRAWGALKFDRWLKPEQRKETKEQLAKQHNGAARSGTPLILEGGVNWQPISFSPADAQMLESRSFSIEEQCRFFGVPPVLIGHNEKTSSFGTGVGQIVQGFEKFTLRRRLKRIEKVIQKQILTSKDRGDGIYVKFSLEALLRGNAKERSEVYKTQIGSGIMTINEGRALEDRPPIDGGDVVRLQAQYIPIDQLDDINKEQQNGGSDA